MAEQLKYMYNEKFINTLITILKKYYTFDSDYFKDLIFDSNWDNLELKERMYHIAS